MGQFRLLHGHPLSLPNLIGINHVGAWGYWNLLVFFAFSMPIITHRANRIKLSMISVSCINPLYSPREPFFVIFVNFLHNSPPFYANLWELMLFYRELVTKNMDHKGFCEVRK